MASPITIIFSEWGFEKALINRLTFDCLNLKSLVVDPKERTARWPKTNNGEENLYWKRYSLGRDAA